MVHLLFVKNLSINPKLCSKKFEEEWSRKMNVGPFDPSELFPRLFHEESLIQSKPPNLSRWNNLLNKLATG